MTTALPVLYSFRRCPYAMRARLALAVSAQACELREVVLRSKPPALLLASPKGTVPVLVKPDGEVLDQSLGIMRWTLQNNDPQHWLIPDSGSIADLNSLIGECDESFKQHLDRYKYPGRHEGADAMEHRSQGLAWVAGLDLRLQDQPFLFGPHMGLADAAIAPFVRQFAQTDPAWFSQQPLPHLQKWLDDFLTSALLESVMHKYPAWNAEANSPPIVFAPPFTNSSPD